MSSNPAQRAKALGVFSLVMITVVSVDSIRNLPSTALFGSSLIFFFVLAAITFLFPCALVSAELASAWSDEGGGVYTWLKDAFGERFGFLAVWFQWVENVVWFPTILAFVAGTIGYLISPNLADSKLYLASTILALFWGATIVNLFGLKASARFSNICAITGLLFPMMFIILLGAIWISTDQPNQLVFSLDSIMPNDLDFHVWSSMVAIILSFAGMELTGVYAKDVYNPQKSYPRAMIYAVLIITVTLLLASLSIASVVPQEKLSLVSGMMQAFDWFFVAYHMHWMLPVMAIVMVMGTMGSINSWIMAPISGFAYAAHDGLLPTFFDKKNKHNAPQNLLIAQACLVTLITGAFLLIPSINGVYWLLTALSAQLYMFMYVLLFVAAIYLRYKFPHKPRPFRIWGRTNLGMWIIAGLGITGCLLTITVGFIPPLEINVGNILRYDAIMLGALALMSLPPFLLHRFRR